MNMKIDYRFLQANIGGLIGLIVLVLSYLFKIDQFVGFKTISLLTIVCFYIYCTAFEYQRITLTLARCIKVKIGNEENIGVVEIQELLSSPIMGYVLLSEGIVFGIVGGFLLRISVVYLLIILFVKYIVLAWIPTPAPFGVLFKLIDKELTNTGKQLMLSGRMNVLITLISIYKRMPHNKTYEDWAFKEYGNDLLA